MKKLTFLAVAIITLLCLSNCNNQAEQPTVAEPVSNHNEVTKIADYLYTITYTDLDDAILEQLSNPEAAFVKQEGACSSVRNGNFHGRNLDLFYNEMCEVVVRVEKSENRFASLAVCGAKADVTPAVMDSLTEDLYQRLPFSVLDGINENGVVCNINVVSGEDSEPTTGTNPEGENLSLACANRYILDHATSAQHAVQLLQEHNLMGGFGSLGLHLMISDSLETYIVEFVDNQMVYYQGPRESNSNIMTNLFSTKLPELNPHALGVERYAILQANYEEGNTLEGMVNLMQRVKYTQAYQRCTEPFWYSEFNGGAFTVDTPNADKEEAIEKNIEDFERHERTGLFWQTVNTSVYDIENRSLRLYVQENYDAPYDFKL